MKEAGILVPHTTLDTTRMLPYFEHFREEYQARTSYDVTLIVTTEFIENFYSDYGSPILNLTSMRREIRVDGNGGMEPRDIEKKYDINIQRQIIPQLYQDLTSTFSDQETYKYYRDTFIDYLFCFEKLVQEQNFELFFYGIGPYLSYRACGVISNHREVEKYVFYRSPYRNKGVLFASNASLGPDDILGKPELDEIPKTNVEEVRNYVDQLKENQSIGSLGSVDDMSGSIYKFLFKTPVKDFLANKWLKIKSNSGLSVSDFTGPLVKLFRTLYQKNFYAEFSEDYDFFFFPLHHRYETELFLRSEPFINQYYLVEHLSRNLPADTHLIVKEHPEAVGTYPADWPRKINKLQRTHMIEPTVNPHYLLSRSSGIITLRSSTGFEAFMHNKPVLAYSRSFYSDNKHVIRNNNLYNTQENMEQLLSMDIDPEYNLKYLTSIYEASYDVRYQIPRVLDKNPPEEDLRAHAENLAQAMVEVSE